MSFTSLKLPQILIDKLTSMGYTAPTEIQKQAIPAILDNRDILASSQTGSGKTGAFVIPIITKLLESTEQNTKHNALILVPTRELALQINTVICAIRGVKEQQSSDDKFSGGRNRRGGKTFERKPRSPEDSRSEDGINVVTVFGGASMENQMFALRKVPNIIVATPGRLQDHIKRRTVNLEDFGILVLDEFDRMLDMGFRDDIANIVRHLPKERQTLMFSATKRGTIITQAKSYLKNFIEITIDQPKESHANITQKFIELQDQEKYATLLKEISEREGSILVFVNMKRIADELESFLQQDGIQAHAIHGDLRQRQREGAIKRFREEKYRVLIATDVVARGIDIPHVKHVVNYDTPRTFEDYTHRIGRTGRGGATGDALTFVTRSEKMFYSNILKQVDSDLAEQTFPSRRPQNARRSFGGDRGGFGGDRAPRNYGDRAPRRDGAEGGFPPRGNREGNREGSRDAGFGGNRDRNVDGNRSDDRAPRRFDDRRRPEGSSFERPERSFDRPKRSFDDRPARPSSDSRPNRDGNREGNREGGISGRVKSFFRKNTDR